MVYDYMSGSAQGDVSLSVPNPDWDHSTVHCSLPQRLVPALAQHDFKPGSVFPLIATFPNPKSEIGNPKLNEPNLRLGEESPVNHLT
jgi:hypothetical protein